MNDTSYIPYPSIKPGVHEKILWLEDHRDEAENVAQLLLHRDPSCGTVVVEKSDEALQQVRSRPFFCIVVDISLDDDPTDGLWVAKEIRRFDKLIPIVVVSSFVSQHAADLADVPNLTLVVDKDELAADATRMHALVDDLIEIVNGYKAYLRLNLDHVTPEQLFNGEIDDSDLDRHEEFNDKWTQEYLIENGLAWLVLCGGQIVGESSTLRDYPDESELIRLATKYDRIPYIYSVAVISEELYVGDRNTSFYPSLPIRVNEHELVADFDTGTNYSFLPKLAGIEKGVFTRMRKREQHGEVYQYWMQPIRVAVFDEHGNHFATSVTCAIVPNWNDSPWVFVRPSRQALLGRGIFEFFRATVSIDCQNNVAVCSLATVSIREND